jgi:hypothetical protein
MAPDPPVPDDPLKNIENLKNGSHNKSQDKFKPVPWFNGMGFVNGNEVFKRTACKCGYGEIKLFTTHKRDKISGNSSDSLSGKTTAKITNKMRIHKVNIHKSA